ncbi:MAG: hypothetical protein ABG776_10955 [Cyanobacteria bacterium J06555_13]
MKLSKKAGIAIPAVAAAIALAAALAPQLIQRGVTAFGTSDRFASQHFAIIPDSISSGSTFQVEGSRKAITVSLCGIEALGKGHPLEMQARDRLQGLLDRGNGNVALIPVTRDGRTQMVAEAFILLPGVPRELHLNSQMLSGGMAQADKQTIETCPNGGPMQRAASAAIQQANGVWAKPIADNPLSQ